MYYTGISNILLTTYYFYTWSSKYTKFNTIKDAKIGIVKKCLFVKRGENIKISIIRIQNVVVYKRKFHKIEVMELCLYVRKLSYLKNNPFSEI